MTRSWQLGVLAVVGAVVISAAPAVADWPTSGRELCTDPANQFLPIMVPDGSGGAIVGWGDSRQMTTYSSRVLRNGFIASGWLADGVQLGEGTGYYGQGRGVPDGAGGAYFAWASDPVPSVNQILLQRVTGSGGIAAGWPAPGLEVGTTATIGLLPRVATDGSGGVYVCWYESPALRIQRIQADGTVSPGWPAAGALVTSVSGSFQNPFVVEDGSGGAIVAWTDLGSDAGDVRAQHIDSGGAPATGWPADGIVVCAESGAQNVAGAIVDGAGGAWLVWADDRNSGVSGRDIYTERITGSGDPAPGWPAGGLPACDAAGAQITPRIAGDGSGGAYVIWMDRRSGPAGDPYVQHLGSDGAPIAGWPAQGTPICIASGGEQLSLDAIAGDGAGGAIFVWSDARDTLLTARDVYAQRFDSNGSVHAGWTANGVALCTSPGDQSDVHCVPDGAGGAIVVWQDGRSGDSNDHDVYAIGIRNDGTTPVLVSLVRAEAAGDRVILDWYAPTGLPGGATIERRAGGEEWTAVASASPDAAGHTRYVDDDIVRGLRYGYRLAAAGAPLTAETWVDVPVLDLSVVGAEADPDGVLSVRFSLRSPAPASLQLFDIAGRRERLCPLVGLDPGIHATRLPGALAPGVYWVRLTQDGRSVGRRVLVSR